MPAWAGHLARGEQATLARLTEAARNYFDAAIGPYWQQIRSHVAGRLS